MNGALLCLFPVGDTVLHTVHREMETDVNENDACPLGPALHEGGVPNPKDPNVTAIIHRWAINCFPP